MRMQRTLKQVEEGELLVENHKLEVEFDDNTSIRRNRSRFYISKIITIQRAWRAYLKSRSLKDNNELSCDSDSTVDSDSSDEMNSQSEMIHTTEQEDPSPVIAESEGVIAMYDLESSVELDDGEFARLQQAIEDKNNKNVNNLSLAEEFANLQGTNSEDDDEESSSVSKDNESEVETNENIILKEDIEDSEKECVNERTACKQARTENKLKIECKQKDEEISPPVGIFDVYNLEDTTMPVLDWASLEEHLANMSKDENTAREHQRNNREEILRKLAMAGDDDDIEGDIYGKGKEKLSSRLQSGMNLQICFVNDSLSDSENNDEDDIVESPKPITKETLTPPQSPVCDDKPEVKQEESEDFAVKQARLQEEAKLALAQARPMARMQIQVEKQQRKKSPVAELAGAAGLTEITDGLCGKRMLKKSTLVTMTVSQIKTIVNDLRSQIENLNEELVQQLIIRDDLQMEQDSKLVDIEDLTRWINMNMERNNNKASIDDKQQRLIDSGNKRQYDTLLSLLSNTLPVSRKCMCGVSRSSSMSSRSISSPESQKSLTSPLENMKALSSPTDSTGTDHISSPELTWVRQAIVKYWYT
uniref:SUN domain-containing protein 2-like n=1 Tax=Saccoglossus kowalevskii TaxID=10224 RepID=A0ABM0LUG0_SACKO|nr:PREDICTED: SUN domain-containing protein 2-like [Saccoglossus kowalevskii]